MSTRNIQKEIKDMIASIADKFGYPYDLVEDIYIHQFEYVAEQIKRGEKNNPGTYETILLKKLGTFIANEKHIIKLKEINDAKQKETTED